jgi:HAE1 family hydrophobic/amphiphilic exporter-1
VESELKKVPEIHQIATTIGSGDSPSNAVIAIALVPSHARSRHTQDVKDEIRNMLNERFTDARPRVNDYSAIGGVHFPFNLNIKGDSIEEIGRYSQEILKKLKDIPDLADVDTNYRTGKPEFQVVLDPDRMRNVGVQPAVAGAELRYHIAGGVVGKLHDRGLEYDILMRLKPEQRNLRGSYDDTQVPNMNNRMIPLHAFSRGREAEGPALIVRQDRSRVVTITANLAPGGSIDSATKMAQDLITKNPPPAGVTYAFIGQSEDFKELIQNMLFAFGLALIFIYLVLSSLYESFITPITILIAIPPAISGAFYALLIFGEMLNIFSMIGVILLMGLVTKNSILLVDLATRRINEGVDRDSAILEAGEKRLRPILMTSIAMIAGTLPIALGLGEAAKSRTAMGIAIIGGLVLSTLITLIVVPAIFKYIDRFREFVEKPFRPDYDMDRVGKLDQRPYANEADFIGSRGGRRK